MLGDDVRLKQSIPEGDFAIYTSSPQQVISFGFVEAATTTGSQPPPHVPNPSRTLTHTVKFREGGFLSSGSTGVSSTHDAINPEDHTQMSNMMHKYSQLTTAPIMSVRLHE